MNKITPHLLRDLDSTLPTGTECYLRPSARKALTKHRKGRQPATFVSKERAISLLAQRLGRGLKRFLVKDLRTALPTEQACIPEKMA
ncbi:MAG: hypothetical protein M0R33_06755 [Methylomonas sp.]|jgi:hypothetical protein|uniref:hypothetical protein n=1 Tax=Methylomonas sp. TaxID=418 RepID=UPI0025ED4144|nr:hypothetical protein [Methylomonas sp.]MCK9606138.1 hypothetical protein [Methylomonas sp.]